MSQSYISRTLQCEGQQVRDEAIVKKNGVFIVLAEPGAGKSDFLDFLAHRLGIKRQTASGVAAGSLESGAAVLIDSLDEVARIDELATDRILVAVAATKAKLVVVASRSYVWDEARTHFARKCFGYEPVILRLEPFDTEEQAALFAQLALTGEFEAFRKEVGRFDLSPLLGNPEFLKLLASAYEENDHRFSTKRQIFVDAIKRLARERPERSSRGRPPIGRIINIASEVFTKVLLTGAAGVSAREEIGEISYPFYGLFRAEGDDLSFAIDTQLFRPGPKVGLHDPVHRIVAEYAAAQFLVAKIKDPSNTFSIRRCLALIAPNNSVRSELRGMLGWMATLGNQDIQQAVIAVDPYAVIAGGDPSELLPQSKRDLLMQLERLAKVDPYFRRKESTKHFNTGTFFAADLKAEFSRLLGDPNTTAQLKTLLLELVGTSPKAELLEKEICALLLQHQAELTIRRSAQQVLAGIKSHDHKGDFQALVAEATVDSLELATTAVGEHGGAHFGKAEIFSLLRAAADLFPGETNTHGFSRRSPHSIRRLIAQLIAEEVIYYLDKITDELVCSCVDKDPYRCICLIGPSKIAGLLLDRYFEIAIGPHDPKRIARWTKQLTFRNYIDRDRSASVRALENDPGLRQAVQLLAFEGLSEPEHIRDVAVNLQLSRTHAGLQLYAEDVRAIVDAAALSQNVALWIQFFAGHDPFAKKRSVNELRSYMRRQARASKVFLRAWSRRDRQQKLEFTKIAKRLLHSDRLFAHRQSKQRALLSQYQVRDQALIKSGRHFWWLSEFAVRYVLDPTSLHEVVDDPAIVEMALTNCLPFVLPHSPTLEEVGLRVKINVVTVLEAACLAIFRKTGKLAGIEISVLQAVRANGGGGNGYRAGESQRLRNELERLLFQNESEVVDFSRRYIEPQLALGDTFVAQTYLLETLPLRDEIRGALATEWLERFPAMPWNGLEQFFRIAAEHGDPSRVRQIIDDRCHREVGPFEPNSRRRRFWLLRHFFFAPTVDDNFWTEFSCDPRAVLEIAIHAQGLNHDGAGWPELRSAKKLVRVLDAFVDRWPQVPLKSSFGSSSPEGEIAYRFLREVPYMMAHDDPTVVLPTLEKLLADSRFGSFVADLKTQKAATLRKIAVSFFRVPELDEIIGLLDKSQIATVEDLRAFLIEELEGLQKYLKGGETDATDAFYSGQRHVDENRARNRVVDLLRARLRGLNISVEIEAHMAQSNRCDITATSLIGGRQAKLVIEAKGQWHPKLYTAASAQLAERYAIHPDAENQGIYLVFWFGPTTKIAGGLRRGIKTANDLRKSIMMEIPTVLQGRVDVFVLDVSKPARPCRSNPVPSKDSPKFSTKDTASGEAPRKRAAREKSAR